MKRELAALISLTVLATIAAARADDGGAYKVVPRVSDLSGVAPNTDPDRAANPNFLPRPTPGFSQVARSRIGSIGVRARQSPLVRGRETPRRRVSHQRLEASALLRVERPAYSIPFSGCTSEPVCAKSSCQPPYLREVIGRNSFRSPGYSMGSRTGG